jgi:alpha-L-fucosidase
MDPRNIGREEFGKDAWAYHRETFGHQSTFGYKDVCDRWKAEKFDADATVKLFKKWGARYVAIMGNHHDNYDLFNSSVHGWNTTRVGPKRDIVGEFAAAARKQNLKWAVSIHAYRAKNWFAPAFGSDMDGPLKGVPYDGNLTTSNGKGNWWDGLDPQQLYAHNYDAFESELTQRHLDLVANYHPDMIYFDDGQIPAPILPACERLYQDSFQKHRSIQTIVSVKGVQTGTIRDYEKGVAEGIPEDYWQTDTTFDGDWFLKQNDDGSSRLIHNARSLKELLADIISRRGTLLLNIAVRADGSIPEDQFREMEELGDWIKGNREAIYGTQPWVVHGEGGVIVAGHFNERGISSDPWDYRVQRFTCNKKKNILYVYLFGNPATKKIVISALSSRKKYFEGQVRKVILLGTNNTVSWRMDTAGLHVNIPEKLAYKDCNVLKIQTTGL